MKKKVIIIGFVVCFIIIIVSGIIIIKNIRNNLIGKKIDEIINNNNYEIKAYQQVVFKSSEKFLDTFENRLLRLGRKIGILRKQPEPGSPVLTTYYIGNDYIIQVREGTEKKLPDKYNSNDETKYYKEKTIYYFDNGDTKKLLDSLNSFSCETEDDVFIKIEKDGEDLYNLPFEYLILLNEIIDKSVSEQTSYEKENVKIESLRREIDERKFN